MTTAPLTLDDYIGAHRVIRAVLTSRGESPAKSCFFFALAGAQILRTHFHQDAKVIAGSFCLCAGPSRDWLMTFGHWDGTSLTSDSHAFHSWIQCEGYVVDLMAPVLNLATNQSGAAFDISKRSFQRPVSSMSIDPSTVVHPGDFWAGPDAGLTGTLLAAYLESEVITHWADVCCRWFTPSPLEIRRTLAANDMAGRAVHPMLDQDPVLGHW